MFCSGNGASCLDRAPQSSHPLRTCSFQRLNVTDDRRLQRRLLHVGCCLLQVMTSRVHSFKQIIKQTHYVMTENSINLGLMNGVSRARQANWRGCWRALFLRIERGKVCVEHRPLRTASPTLAFMPTQGAAATVSRFLSEYCAFRESLNSHLL